MEELPYYEDEFEHAKMNPRGIQVKNDFISAMRLYDFLEVLIQTRQY